MSLNAMECSALTHHEAVIERGLETFVEVGNALAAIRDDQLYRDEFLTFADYCSDRWNISRSRAYQLISAADVSTNVDIENEGQARALAGLEPERQVEVFQEAKSRFETGQPTGAQLRAVRNPLPLPTEVREQKGLRDLSPEDFVGPMTPQDAAPSGPRDGDSLSATDVASVPRPAVTGLDGKVYNLPKPKARLQAVPEPVEYDDQDHAEELAKNLSRNLSLLYAVTNPERRAEYIATWRDGTKEVQPLGSDFITPGHMRALAAALEAFATEWESADV